VLPQRNMRTSTGGTVRLAQVKEADKFEGAPDRWLRRTESMIRGEQSGSSCLAIQSNLN